jgi:hypothetical protein
MHEAGWFDPAGIHVHVHVTGAGDKQDRSCLAHGNEEDTRKVRGRLRWGTNRTGPAWHTGMKKTREGAGAGLQDRSCVPDDVQYKHEHEIRQRTEIGVVKR